MKSHSNGSPVKNAVANCGADGKMSILLGVSETRSKGSRATSQRFFRCAVLLNDNVAYLGGFSFVGRSLPALDLGAAAKSVREYIDRIGFKGNKAIENGAEFDSLRRKQLACAAVDDQVVQSFRLALG